MANSLTQQMTIRIAPALKVEGDSVFESLGWSSSQAVRALYETAVRHKYDAAALRSFLTGSEGEEDSEPVAENAKLRIAEEGRRAADQAIKELGISKEAMQKVWSTTSDKELLEQARYERMVERGLASGETEAR